jgi:putative ABC transporter
MTNPLAEAVENLAALLPGARFPLPLEGATELREQARTLTSQVHDYLLPRARRLDAPLLAVVGGSTGAGKSTLVNSLLGQAITKTGVRRPTTTAPTLICNPADRDWFRSGSVLPHLTRADHPAEGSRSLRIIVTEALPEGLALLDAPDIDSIDDDNRRLARQLFAASDLWLFVTTASRYADAVAWELLATAAARDVFISVVLNRCPPGSSEDLTTHLRELLAQRGIRPQQVFTLHELEEPPDGLLPSRQVSQIRMWLGGIAINQFERRGVATQTLAGAVRGLDTQLLHLADGANQQLATVAQLRQAAEAEFAVAAQEISRATSDGTMLRGEVLSRWQDLIGTGDLMRRIEKRIVVIRDRIASWFVGRENTEDVQIAISEGLATLIEEQGTAACERAAAHWSLTPWGDALVDGDGDPLSRPGIRFRVEAIRLVRAWQNDIFTLVNEEGRGKRRKARFLALGTNAVGVALIMVVFATTGGLTTAEVGIAGGSSLLAQRLLEGIFGTDAVRHLSERARTRLEERVADLLDTQMSRFNLRLELMAVPSALPQDLTLVAEQLRSASDEAFEALTRPEGY